MRMDRMTRRWPIALLALIAAACSSSPGSAQLSPSSGPPSAVASAASSLSASPPAVPAGLTTEDVAALNSLSVVDAFPLYRMELHHSVAPGADPETPPPLTGSWDTSWACSLFAALANPEHRLFGRNFDWDFSPALLLSYFPSDGYSSVSMVDIDFLGYSGASARGLDSASLADRRRLLGARFLPFDGMNEKGLVVAMAAVPTAVKTDEPGKPSMGSIGIIREMLDHAANVDEAVALFRRYNINVYGGPPIHYLLADASGKAVLLEFAAGQLVVKPNERPWHLATNFIVAEAGSRPEDSCPRYEKLSKKLTETGGSLTPDAALELLRNVAQEGTQWSAVYEISSGDVSIALGREYAKVHTFHLSRST